jgi:hypothetical protein
VIRPSVLLLAALLASPAFYLAVIGELSVQTALSRFLLAVVAAALMRATLRFITAGYGDRRQPQLPLRRRTDPPAEPRPEEPAPAEGG